MRIAFMGTPDFAVPTLEALIAAGHDVAAVYSQPPRPAGRGKAPRPSPVQKRAEAAGIEVRTPLSLKDPDAQAAFAALDLDVAVVAAYGLILPGPILDAPRLGCLNVHASLLPRWRGAAPIQRAILAGDRMTGVTIMQMEEGLDTGPMLATMGTAGRPQDRRRADRGARPARRRMDGRGARQLRPDRTAPAAGGAGDLRPQDPQGRRRASISPGRRSRSSGRCAPSTRRPAPGSRRAASGSSCSPPSRSRRPASRARCCPTRG